MDKSLLSVGAVAAMLVLAGCSGGIPGGSGGGGTGAMAFYVSDQHGSIGDFSHLNATVTSVGVHKVNGTGNQSGEWVTKNLSSPVTVDLTKLQGDKAANLVNTSLQNGTYNNVFVHVSSVNGTLTDGSSADVKLPSNKLHLKENFTVGNGEQSHFVFDLMVHGTGNGKYILRPNAGQSGKGQKMTHAPGAKQGAGSGQGTKKQNKTHKTTTGQNSMEFYLSDRPAAIGDFEHLNVTVSKVGVHRANASGNESAWVEENASNLTVDLTKLQGDKAVNVANLTGLENGTYDNVFVHVSSVNGTLTDGSHPDVKLPSNKLHVHQQFSVGGNESSHFVFDVAVHETGNGRYMIKPNVGDTGKNKSVDKVSKKHAKPDSSNETEQSGNQTTTTTQSDNQTTTSRNQTTTTTSA